VDIAGNALILLGYPLFGIDHHQHHVGTFNTAECITDTVFLKFFRCLSLRNITARMLLVKLRNSL
jgi:hypothetical protein